MAEITAALVKALRDKTDAGMMDCKKALNECNGDMDAAVKYLREKGIAKAAAKADRDAKEGVIRAAVAPCGCSGIILELNCETDFCAKGDKFQGLVNDVANALMDSKASTLEEALQVPMAEGSTEEYIKAMCSSIGENMALRKFARLTADGIGAVVSCPLIHRVLAFHATVNIRTLFVNGREYAARVSFEHIFALGISATNIGVKSSTAFKQQPALQIPRTFPFICQFNLTFS